MPQIPLEYAYNIITNFEIDYSNQLDIPSIDRCREECVLRFEEMLQNMSLETITPLLQSAITKKLAQINGQAKERKFTIHSSVPLTMKEDAIRYRLSQSDMDILIKLKKEKRDINCFVINGTNPFSVSDFLNHLVRRGKQRTQLIFKVEQSEHWSILDIQRNPNGALQVFLIDTTEQKNNCSEVIRFCSQQNIELTLAMGEIQKDFASCSIFALDMAFHLSKISNLHEQLDEVRREDPKALFRYIVEPLDLPPVLIKNAQSKTFIHQYLNLHPEYEETTINPKAQTLRDYVTSHQVLIDDHIIYGAINYKQAKYRKRVNDYKGYPNNLDYHEHITEHAQHIHHQAIVDILNIQVPIEMLTTIDHCVFYYHSLLNQIDEIRSFYALRDAHAILNIKGTPHDLNEAHYLKRKEIIFAMERSILTLHPSTDYPLKSSEAQKILERIAVLQTLNFDEHLVVIHTMSVEMNEKIEDNPQYIHAAEHAAKLYRNLEKAKLKFLNTKLTAPLPGLKQSLIQDCQRLLTHARTRLNYHREWAGNLVFFGTEVLNVLTVQTFTSGLSFFSSPNSVKTIDDISEQLSMEL